MIRKLLRKIINKSYCRIEEIDLVNNKIVIYCPNVDTAIKFSFDEIINDDVIITNLISKHAAWIGYYYGRYYRELLNNNMAQCPTKTFALNATTEQQGLVINMINRQGEIIYYDDEAPHTISPVNALKDEKLMMRFNAMNACYIGILAGVASSKNKITANKKSRAELRLVK